MRGSSTSSDQHRASAGGGDVGDSGDIGGGVTAAGLDIHQHSRRYYHEHQYHDQTFTRSHSAPDAHGNYDHFYFPHQQQRPSHAHGHHSAGNSLSDISGMNGGSNVGTSNNSSSNSMAFSFYQQQQNSRTSPPSGSLVALLREHRSPDATLPERDSLGGRDLFSGRQRSRSNSSASSESNESLRANQISAMDECASQTSSPSPSPPPAPTVVMRQHHQQQLARASKATVAIARVTTADAAAAGGTTSSNNGGAKRSRYLREGDRRNIIHRIDRGEKQAALAKEFGVTRAAICHINKNRIEILTRSTRADVHAAARHPKRGLYNTSASSGSAAAHAASKAAQSALENHAAVLEVRSQPMAVLMTALRRRETQARDFQVCADRAFRLLLEEALARVALRVIDVVTPGGGVCEGVAVDRPSCGVAVSEDGFALLQAFRSIQPASASGYITLTGAAERNGLGGVGGVGGGMGVGAEPTLQHVCVPPDLRAHDVFLLEATCASSAGACAAIQALLDLGALEPAIHFVCLLASAPAVAEMSSRFPRVRVVAGAIDPDVGDDGAICPGLGRFSERYFNTTVVHRYSRDGSTNADV